MRRDEHDAVRNIEPGSEAESVRWQVQYQNKGDLLVELVAREVEVLFHARHVGIANVGLIEIFDDYDLLVGCATEYMTDKTCSEKYSQK